MFAPWHHRRDVVAAVALEDSAPLRLGIDSLDAGDGRSRLDAAPKRSRARLCAAQYHHIRAAGIRHRGADRRVAYTRIADTSQLRGRRTDGGPPLAWAL